MDMTNLLLYGHLVTENHNREKLRSKEYYSIFLEATSTVQIVASICVFFVCINIYVRLHKFLYRNEMSGVQIPGNT